VPLAGELTSSPSAFNFPNAVSLFKTLVRKLLPWARFLAELNEYQSANSSRSRFHLVCIGIRVRVKAKSSAVPEGTTGKLDGPRTSSAPLARKHKEPRSDDQPVLEAWELMYTMLHRTRGSP